MSSDDQDTPPKKLGLSRDKSIDADAEKPAPPSGMKLKRKSDTEEPASPIQETPQPSTPPETEATPSGENNEDFDPKNPFGDIIKEDEIKKPKGPPPELPSKPHPKIDDGSGAKVEEAIQTLNKPQDDQEAPQNSEKSSFLASIVVILILLAVLGGAGYGIWKVLLTPEDGVAETEGTDSNGPIQKAKDVVAQVNSAKADAENEMESFTGEAQNGASAVNAQPKVGTNQQIITEYLSSVHIGGMRDGDRPMVILNGTSYRAGDTVQQESGLTFAGFRDGKPAFRDKKGIVYLKSF